ncbi:MAG TPA: hypothetical protein PKD00_05640 [Burkholderiales bacterium]|nr:hypothetical protein [Burkholderiales bacterium]
MSVNKIQVIRTGDIIYNKYARIEDIIDVYVIETELFKFISEKEFDIKTIRDLMIYGSKNYWRILYSLYITTKNKEGRKLFLENNPDYDEIDFIFPFDDSYDFKNKPKHISLYKVGQNTPIELSFHKVIDLYIEDIDEYDEQNCEKIIANIEKENITIVYE